MEIFHAFGIDYRLLIVQIVNFGVLLLVLWKFLYTPLLKMMDDRKAAIHKGVLDAEHASKKLAEAEAEKRALLTKAAQDADALSERARKDAAEKERHATLEAEAKAARVLAEAESKSAEMKQQALAESKQEIAKLVVLGMEHALKQK
jgi:F-type H+-transporting ATPase subunit b